jgi:hypothetical protein
MNQIKHKRKQVENKEENEKIKEISSNANASESNSNNKDKKQKAESSSSNNAPSAQEILAILKKDPEMMAMFRKPEIMAKFKAMMKNPNYVNENTDDPDFMNLVLKIQTNYNSKSKSNNVKSCDLCNNSRMLCPGCTNGKLQKEFPELFMGCGVLIRCPECVDYNGALEDKELFNSLYHNTDDESENRIGDQCDQIERAILLKYPEWKYPLQTPMH